MTCFMATRIFLSFLHLLHLCLQRAGVEIPVVCTNVHGNFIMHEEISKRISD